MVLLLTITFSVECASLMFAQQDEACPRNFISYASFGTGESSGCSRSSSGFIPESFPGFKEEKQTTSYGDRLFRTDIGDGRLILWCYANGPMLAPPVFVTLERGFPSPDPAVFHELQAVEVTKPQTRTYNLAFRIRNVILKIATCSEKSVADARQTALRFAEILYDYHKGLPEIILRQLSSKDLSEQQRALTTLSNIRIDDDPRVLQFLIQFAQKESLSAILGLRLYPEQADVICPVLIQLLMKDNFPKLHPSFPVSYLSGRALVEIDLPSLQQLLEMARTSNGRLRAISIDLMEQIVGRGYYRDGLKSIRTKDLEGLKSFVSEQLCLDVNQNAETRATLEKISYYLNHVGKMPPASKYIHVGNQD